MTDTVYGVRIPNGFNGSQEDIIESLFGMSAATIQAQKMFNGFTIDLERSPLGEWRYSLTPKDK